MKLCAFILFISLMLPAVHSLLHAQEIPTSISSVLYQMTNEGIDTIIVYLPAFNDQMQAAEHEMQPFYVFWRLKGGYFCRKYVRGAAEGGAVELVNSNIVDIAAEHFGEIENEEILEPYYRQIQRDDTVWIMFPPSGYLKDIFLIQSDGLRIVKFVDNSSLDAKEYYTDDIYNIHYTVNTGLYTAILRKNIRAEIADLERQKKFQHKQ